MKKGHWVRFSENRRLVLDICALSRRMPLFPAERHMNLGFVEQARDAAVSRISWATIFTKALALTAAAQPAFRQAYMRWPWAHLYEHAFSTASIAVHRQDRNEDRLCWAMLSRVEEMSLKEIQDRLDGYKNAPIHEAFRKQWRMSRLPTVVRRVMWALGLHLSGRQRAKTIGTFTVSSLAGLGAYNRFHPTIATSSLSYGPIDDDGDCLVTLICDHRVIDGYRAAIALQQLETTLATTITEELRSLGAEQPIRRAA